MPVKEILLTVLYLLLFNALILRFKQLQFSRFKPWVTAALFNLKFATGIFIWLVYTFYYKDVQNNDIHKFYNDALVLRNVASQDPGAFVKILTGIDKHNQELQQYCAPMKNWERNFDEAPFNENQTVIKLNALLMFISLRTYFVHILVMCFIALMGWVLLVNALSPFIKKENMILVLPVMLLPSVLFWTSGVMKEPLLVFGMGLTIAGMLKFQRPVSLADLTLGILVLLLSKFFVLACIIAPLAAFLLPVKTGAIKVAGKYVAVIMALLLVAFNINALMPAINPAQMLVNKQTHSIKEADYFKAGSRIEIPVITANAGSILKAAPIAVGNTLLRPCLWEGKNIMMVASAIENVFIILFILLSCFYTDWKNIKHINLLLFLLCFSLGYYALVGICTPVLGNLVRYRAPLLPVMTLAFIINCRALRLTQLSTVFFNK